MYHIYFNKDVVKAVEENKYALVQGKFDNGMIVLRKVEDRFNSVVRDYAVLQTKDEAYYVDEKQLSTYIVYYGSVYIPNGNRQARIMKYIIDNGIPYVKLHTSFSFKRSTYGCNKYIIKADDNIINEIIDFCILNEITFKVEPSQEDPSYVVFFDILTE